MSARSISLNLLAAALLAASGLVHADLGFPDTVKLPAQIVVNPDQTKTLTGVETTAANDITRPGIVGMRGYGIQFEYRNTSNRGSITNYTVSAYVQDQKLTKSP